MKTGRNYCITVSSRLVSFNNAAPLAHKYGSRHMQTAGGNIARRRWLTSCTMGLLFYLPYRPFLFCITWMLLDIVFLGHGADLQSLRVCYRLNTPRVSREVQVYHPWQTHHVYGPKPGVFFPLRFSQERC